MKEDRHTMGDREPTRWQHNCIYPQHISLCIIVIYDCVKITNILRTQSLYHAHCGQGSLTDCYLFALCHLEKYPDEINHNNLLSKSYGRGGGWEYKRLCSHLVGSRSLILCMIVAPSVKGKITLPHI